MKDSSSESLLTHFAISVGHSERDVGGHEKQQGLLVWQLLPQSLDHFGPFGGSLQINSRVNEQQAFPDTQFHSHVNLYFLILFLLVFSLWYKAVITLVFLYDAVCSSLSCMFLLCFLSPSLFGCHSWSGRFWSSSLRSPHPERVG